MRRACLAGLLGLALLLAGCGGRPALAGAHAPSSSRTSASGTAPDGPTRLRWAAGETFTGTVAFDEQDQGAIVDELWFTARERFRVLKVAGGVATLRVALAAWRWQRNTSALLTTSLPRPASFGVNAAGEIVSGVDWPLPCELPLPGLDVFASPLGHVTGWSRTDREGVDLAYQAQVAPASGRATLTWSVTRPQFTRSGDPITVDARAAVSLSSRYVVQGSTVSLRSTREDATFERTTHSAAGSSEESGTVLETTTFAIPSR